MPPRAPLDACAQTGSVTRLVPTRIARSDGLPLSTRLNVTLNVRDRPLYRRDPKLIRSSVESFDRFETRTDAPFAPLTLTSLAVGRTARNAWSNQNFFVRVSRVLLRATTDMLTRTRFRSGWTV